LGGGASAAWRLRWRRARGPGARWACSPFWTRLARTHATRWRRRSATAWTPRWRARPLPPAARESGACVSLTQSWRCPCHPAVRDGLFVCDHTSRVDVGPTLQHQTTQQTGAARALHGGALHASPGRIICGVVAVGAVAPRPCATASAPGRACAQITGDNVLIARETAAALGMGARICTPEGLPALPPDGRVPRDLGKTLAPLVLACDGFAQASTRKKCSGVPATSAHANMSTTLPSLAATDQRVAQWRTVRPHHCACRMHATDCEAFSDKGVLWRLTGWTRRWLPAFRRRVPMRAQVWPEQI